MAVYNAAGERLDAPDPEREAQFREDMRQLVESCPHAETFCIRCLIAWSREESS